MTYVDDPWEDDVDPVDDHDAEHPWRATRPGVSVPLDLLLAYRQAGGTSPSRLLADAMRGWLSERGVEAPPPPPRARTSAATSAAQERSRAVADEDDVEAGVDDAPWRATRPGVSVPRNLIDAYREANGPSLSGLLADAMRLWLGGVGVAPPPPPPPARTRAATVAAQGRRSDG